jgi:hypothetical protein
LLFQDTFVFPEDILNEIKKDKVAWNNFNNFTDSYKRIRIAYIEKRRNRPDQFTKLLNHFLAKTRQNKQIVAYGGDEKYYQ